MNFVEKIRCILYPFHATGDIEMFSGDIERDQWHEMG